MCLLERFIGQFTMLEKTMKFKRKLLCILLMLGILAGMPMFVFADVQSADVNGTAGEVVEIEFTYENIVIINGTFSFSNPGVFTKVELVSSNMAGIYNPANGKAAYYSTFPTDTVLTLKLTLSKDAISGATCDITFEYEASSGGNLPSIPDYERDVVTLTVNSANIDYSALKAQIARAEALKKSDYTSSSWKKMQSALDAAKKALDSKVQSEVDGAANSLKKAIDNLVRKTTNGIDYDELLALIATAEALKEEDYTEETWEVLEEALKDAKANRNSTSQAEVDAAVIALKNAIWGLIKKDGSNWVDYSELNALIAQASILNENDYTKDSWAYFMSALTNARNATYSTLQVEVDEAAMALSRAIEALVRIDYSALLDAIAQVEALADKDTLSDLWRQMHDLLNHASDLLNGGDQDEINKCANDILELLAKIIAELERLSEKEIVEVDKDNFNPNEDYCNVKRHRIWPILFWVSFTLNVVVIGFIAALYIKKKKTEKDGVPLVNYHIEDDAEE